MLASNSPRRKCDRAAIGIAAQRAQHRWSPLGFRIKVRYPLLEMTPKSILAVAFAQHHSHAIGRSPIDELPGPNQILGWRNLSERDTPNWRTHVTDHMSVLINSANRNKEGLAETVSVAQLTWKAKWEYLKYRLQAKTNPHHTCRACWAEILWIFGIRDVLPLVYRMGDADHIPSNIDIPAQRVMLGDLGCLAFLMGFESVNIDIQQRKFSAISPFGTITTESVQGIGNVVHFDGTALKFRELIGRSSIDWLLPVQSLIHGRLKFGVYETNGYFLPLDILSNSISLNHSSNIFDKNLHLYRLKPDKKGVVYEQGKYMTEMMASRAAMPELQGSAETEAIDNTEPAEARTLDTLVPTAEDREQQQILAAFDAWRGRFEIPLPPILVAAAFLPIAGCASAFPVRALLEPYIPWLKIAVNRFWLDNAGRIKISDDISAAIDAGSISSLRETSQYLMSTSTDATMGGMRGWGLQKMEHLLSDLPLPVHPQVTDLNDGSPELLAKKAAKLLEDYDPVGWALDIDQTFTLNMSTRALNLLWFQILVLDMTIQHILHDGWPADDAFVETPDDTLQSVLFGVWSIKARALVHAICESVDDVNPMRISGLSDWPLADHIRQERIWGPLISAEIVDLKVQKLDFLLKLRALFMFAYLSIHHDSSDVYLTAFQDTEMPLM